MDTVNRIFALADKIYPEQQAFAAAVGVSAKTVSVWRTGRGKSYTKYIPQIASALNTTVEYILTGKESSPPSEEDRLNPITAQFVNLFESLSAEDQTQIVGDMLRRKNKK